MSIYSRTSLAPCSRYAHQLLKAKATPVLLQGFHFLTEKRYRRSDRSSNGRNKVQQAASGERSEAYIRLLKNLLRYYTAVYKVGGYWGRLLTRLIWRFLGNQEEFSKKMSSPSLAVL